jgi:hypothetical protein
VSQLSNRVQEQAADTSHEAILFRIFAVATLQGLAGLLCDMSQAAKYPMKLREIRESFRLGLKLPPEQLRDFLTLAAWDVVKSEGPPRGGEVQLPACPTRREVLANGASLTYTYCLLLVSEMLLNHIRHARSGVIGKWSATIDSSRILIHLEHAIDNRVHVSDTFDALHTFLDTVCNGHAVIIPGNQHLLWEVAVPLSFPAEAQ